MMQQRQLFPPLVTPKMAFRNADGRRFIEMGQAWGFNSAVVSQGMCVADLDNDGDLDVIANNLNSVASVYRNNSSKARLEVLLKGRPPNSHGIGARIRVYGGPVPVQSQQIISGGRYLSCDQAARTFAAGSATNLLSIEVDWPSRRRSRVTNVTANYIYEIDEDHAAPADKSDVFPGAQASEPFFEDVSARLSQAHHEDPYDDFSRQPTMAKRLSQLGPGVCWCDLSGNGRDDLVIASGKGGRLSVFLNDGTGGFQSRPLSPPGVEATEDQTSVLAWPGKTRAQSILIGSAGYETVNATNASVLGWDLQSGKLTGLLPAAKESVGPMALGDVDGDGNLDLFVGGRVSPGRYPEPVSSRVYRSMDGVFKLDEANTRVLEKVGMVSGALWSDLDGDGFPELILACEWGPVLVFHNDHGRLSKSDFALAMALPGPGDGEVRATGRRMAELNPRPSTLSQLTGWWNGVTTADLDGDGKLDIVASNWGSNSKYQSHRAGPLRLYYGDFNGDGSLVPLEAYFEPLMGKYVPERRLDIVAQAMPYLRGRFATYQSYADSGIDDILGDRLPQSQFLEANWLESTVFYNRGDRFEPRLMPPEAQFAPAFAVVAADFDGDGNEDLFLSQNFFAVEPETSRYDAGRGLWLKGDGQGALLPVSGAESGLTLYGEQRGAAVADFDRDGRADLVVAQNAAATRLFKNLRGRPGLRVRLNGPAGNPQGIGVQMRVKHGDHLGPVREVHGGSGYWSEDSPVQVLGNVTPPVQLWLRWPGGKNFTVDVPPHATEIQVGLDGSVRGVVNGVK
jgi:enediyne biosynthesis protein E4